MWWAGARSRRPTAALLPAMLLACAAALAAPLGAAAAPAQPASPRAPGMGEVRAVLLVAQGVGHAAALAVDAACQPQPHGRPGCGPRGRRGVVGRPNQHVVRGHGRPGGVPSPAPRPSPAPVPPPASAPGSQPVRVTFDSNAGVAAPVGRSVVALPGNASAGVNPLPGSGPPVGGILSVPQQSLLGPQPRVELGSAVDVWQVIAGAEGAALLAVLAALLRRRRVVGRRGA